MEPSVSTTAPYDEEVQETQLLERLFARHMRARVMLRSVAKAEQEAIAEIIWTLKAVPAERRQALVALCVERAAASIVGDSG